MSETRKAKYMRIAFDITQRRPSHWINDRLEPVVALALRIGGLSKRDAERLASYNHAIQRVSVDRSSDAFLNTPGNRIGAMVSAPLSLLEDINAFWMDVFAAFDRST